MSELNGFQLTTPVVFIIFNRFKEAEKVFEQIAIAKPQKLFVISDGPRSSKPGELDQVNKVRALIDRIDWPCEIYKNFADQNLGCRDRIATGLDWVFDQVESAIILEDDCLPDQTFFRFCQEMLEKYKGAFGVSHITGSNIIGKKSNSESYLFSNYTQIWGWATWSRVWSKYDVGVKFWPSFKKTHQFSRLAGSGNAKRYWIHSVNEVYKGKIDTWDFQFSMLNWINNQVTVVPNKNLISNIGFGINATHTQIENHDLSKLETTQMIFPLTHPSTMSVDNDYDYELSHKFFNMSLKNAVLSYIFHRLPSRFRGIAISILQIYKLASRVRSKSAK